MPASIQRSSAARGKSHFARHLRTGNCALGHQLVELPLPDAEIGGGFLRVQVRGHVFFLFSAARIPLLNRNIEND
jgi:hypothetical protein